MLGNGYFYPKVELNRTLQWLMLAKLSIKTSRDKIK